MKKVCGVWPRLASGRSFLSGTCRPFLGFFSFQEEFLAWSLLEPGNLEGLKAASCLPPGASLACPFSCGTFFPDILESRGPCRPSCRSCSHGNFRSCFILACPLARLPAWIRVDQTPVLIM
jgi:hypothetical protein